MDHTQNVISLCSGIGGLDIALKLAMPQSRTICYCERESFPISVLVEKMETSKLDTAPIWTDLRSFPSEHFQGITDGIIGGYPCQPFSKAGKRRGTSDPRHLWPYIATIIRDTKPTWCFFENVENHIRIGFREVASELQEMGYTVSAGVFTAAEVGGRHIRKRLFILAYASTKQQNRFQILSSPNGAETKNRFKLQDVPSSIPMVSEDEIKSIPFRNDYKMWDSKIGSSIEPIIYRNFNGFTDMLDRYHAIGNAVCPQQAANAFTTLWDELSLTF